MRRRRLRRQWRRRRLRLAVCEGVFHDGQADEPLQCAQGMQHVRCVVAVARHLQGSQLGAGLQVCEAAASDSLAPLQLQ